MWKIVTVISLGLLVSACGAGDFLSGVNKKVDVIATPTVIYPSLPDIDKPLPPILRPVVFDYPRNTKAPKQLIANKEVCRQEPKIPNFDKECLEFPIDTNSNIFIGMDAQSFKNFVANQELINGYGRSLNSRLDEVNAERAKWRESNQQKESSAGATTK